MDNEPQQFVDARPNKLFFKHIIRKIFLEDWVVKLAALIITLALWLGVTGLSTPTRQRLTGVPLTLRFSNDTEVTNSPIQQVDLVISGDKRKTDLINKNDLVVSLDISEVTPGDHFIELTPENVSLILPTGVKLDEIQPNRIPVRIEAVEEREIDVRITTTGTLPDGYEVYGETISPPKVRVRGPASYMRTLSKVSTENVDLSSYTSDFTVRQLPVSVSNPKATVLETVVDAAIRIGEKRVEKIYSVPVKDEPSKKATVTLYGGRSLFSGLTPGEMLVELSRNESGAQTPILILPSSVTGKLEVRKILLQ